MRIFLVLLLALLGVAVASPAQAQGSGFSQWCDQSQVRVINSAQCWGAGSNGQLGSDILYSTRTTPILVRGLSGGFINWTSISVGNNNSCGIQAGQAYCWGDATSGQLGNGTTSPTRNTPSLVLGGFTDWTAISQGDSSSCGIRAGEAYCWGAAANGQLGNGTTSPNRTTPSLVLGGFTDWMTISIGGGTTCGIRAGRAYCWGAAGAGQLGNGTTSPNRTTPSLVLGNTFDTWTPRESNRSWRSITSSADGTRLAAVDSPGQIYTSTDGGVSWVARESTRNWRSIASSADGTRLAAVVNNGQIYTSTNGGVSWVARDSTRYWQSITSSADGTQLAAVVGAVITGQIYTSTNGGVSWVPRESNRWWTDITSSADGTRLAATVASGQIYTSTNGGVSWVPRESNRNWRSSASSADGTRLAAVVEGGQIYTSTDGGASWSARERNRNWWSIVSSADGTRLAAVVDGGQIYTSTNGGVSWVARDSNRWWRGITSSADGTQLAAVATGRQIYTSSEIFTDWTMISKGVVGSHTCGIRAGQAYCWGDASSGQLGNGTTTPTRTTPSLVLGGFTDWTAISAGNDYTCGIRAGQAYCWGQANYGQLGNGTSTPNRTTPSLVFGGFTDWTAISAGGFHTCGIRAGQAYCWGAALNGRLGNDTTSPDITTPSLVFNLGISWTTVMSGYQSTCGIISQTIRGC